MSGTTNSPSDPSPEDVGASEGETTSAPKVKSLLQKCQEKIDSQILDGFHIAPMQAAPVPDFASIEKAVKEAKEKLKNHPFYPEVVLPPAQKDIYFATLYGTSPTYKSANFGPEAQPASWDPIPEELKGFAGIACPECGNHTWKQGWHHAACKYHDPNNCPVKGHHEASGLPCTPPSSASPAPQPAPKFSGPNLLAEYGEIQVIPFEHVSPDTAYVVGGEGGTPAVEDPSKDPVYKKQLRNFAGHHGITLWAAWKATLGAIAQANGYNWENPYKSKSVVPSMKKIGKPHWPNLLHKFPGACNCALCADQIAKTVPPSIKASNVKITKVDGPAIKASMYDGTALSPAITKTATDGYAGFTPTPSMILNLCIKFEKALLHEGLSGYAWAHKMLNKYDLFALTGKQYPAYSQNDLCHMAAEVLEDFMDVPKSDESLWVQKVWEKMHGGHALYHFTMSKDGTAKYSTATVSPPKGLNNMQYVLKPGDQVVVTVDSEGVLVIPEGMKAMVVRK